MVMIGFQFKLASPIPTAVYIEIADGNDWRPYSRTTLNYNGNDQLLDYTVESWDASILVWNTVLRYEYSYNSDQSISQSNHRFYPG